MFLDERNTFIPKNDSIQYILIEINLRNLHAWKKNILSVKERSI